MDTMLDQILTRRTLYAAFERVRDNAGCRGVDGVTVGEFHDNLETELDHIQDRLLRRRYHPLPLLQFQVPKNPERCGLSAFPPCATADASQALELTDYLLEDLHLRLNPDKTRTTSFDEGFKFLGAIFLKDAVYLPFDRPKPQFVTPRFPPPLDLITYLELKNLERA